MTGLCVFTVWMCLCVAGTNMQDISELLTAATGESFTANDLVKAAEREFALERAFNAREGIRKIDDYPFFLRWLLEHGEPNPIFDYKQLPLNLESYDVVLDEYYRLRGCDLKTGIPTRAKLEELGLEDTAKDLTNRKTSVAAKSK